MDTHVIAWNQLIEERQHGWRINESVWSWLIRRTNIRVTKANIKQLADELFVGEATLHRLKKTKQHSINRESLRDQLSRYLIKIPGANDKQLLGYYGYPPGTKYVEDTNSTLSPIQQNINSRLRSDFEKIKSIADINEDTCDFCQPISYHLTPDERAPKIECISIFLSTHRYKQYGAASRQKGKGFELEIKLCKICLKKHSKVFLIPVSSLIKKILNKYNLKQPQLALELGVTQGVISRILHDKAVFINPILLKKIYGLYRIGPDSYYKNEHWKLLLFVADFMAEKIDEEELHDKMKSECYPNSTPWDDDPNFLMEIGLEPMNEDEYRREFKHVRSNFECHELNRKLIILSTEPYDIYFDSNEISYKFEVNYNFDSNSGYPYFENSGEHGTITVQYVLVNIKKRLRSEFFIR